MVEVPTLSRVLAAVAEVRRELQGEVKGLAQRWSDLEMERRALVDELYELDEILSDKRHQLKVVQATEERLGDWRPKRWGSKASRGRDRRRVSR
jgi:septal ring factor EnvC (AmiA/AmiB activator)